jgi:hypothetical protein
MFGMIWDDVLMGVQPDDVKVLDGYGIMYLEFVRGRGCCCGEDILEGGWASSRVYMLFGAAKTTRLQTPRLLNATSFTAFRAHLLLCSFSTSIIVGSAPS